MCSINNIYDLNNYCNKYWLQRTCKSLVINIDVDYSGQQVGSTSRAIVQQKICHRPSRWRVSYLDYDLYNKKWQFYTLLLSWVFVWKYCFNFILIFMKLWCYLLFRVNIANDFVTLTMTFLLKIKIVKDCFCNTSMFQEKKLFYMQIFLCWFYWNYAKHNVVYFSEWL